MISGCPIAAKSRIQRCLYHKNSRGVPPQFNHSNAQINQFKPKPSSTFVSSARNTLLTTKKYNGRVFQHINHPVHKKFLASSPCEDLIQDLVESEQKKRKTPACGFLPSQETSRKVRKYSFIYKGWTQRQLPLRWLCNTSKNQVLAFRFFNPKRSKT